MRSISAGLRYHWHDPRHTFVSRLAENPAVSEETMMALAGHISRSMLARYSHISVAAKQAAIDALEAGRAAAKSADFDAGSPQNSPQSTVDAITEHWWHPGGQPGSPARHLSLTLRNGVSRVGSGQRHTLGIIRDADKQGPWRGHR
jgi:hypothetical protein